MFASRAFTVYSQRSDKLVEAVASMCLKGVLLDLIAAAGGWRQATSAQASVHPQARGETARGETLPEPKGPLLSTPRGGAADDMSQNVSLSLCLSLSLSLPTMEDDQIPRASSPPDSLYRDRRSE